MTETIWFIVILTFNLTNVLLHGAGIYLLWCLRRRSRTRIQNLYLMSLSGSELLMNLLNIVPNLSSLAMSGEQTSENNDQQLKQESTMTRVNNVLLILNFTGIAFVFHVSMIFITFDRLLELLLHIRYPVFWNEEKTKYLLLATWIFGACISIVVCCLADLLDFAWDRYFFTYFFPSIEIIFVVLAIATYTFIFRKFKSTRQSPAGNYTPAVVETLKPPPTKSSNARQTNGTCKSEKDKTFVVRKGCPEMKTSDNSSAVYDTNNNSTYTNGNSTDSNSKNRNGTANVRDKKVVFHQSPSSQKQEQAKKAKKTVKQSKKISGWKIFMKSKFFIPVLLILTFFVFVVGADIVYLVVIVIQKNVDVTISSMLSISYAISNLTDAWIYILLQRDVRRLFIRKFYPSRNKATLRTGGTDNSSYNHSVCDEGAKGGGERRIETVN